MTMVNEFQNRANIVKLEGLRVSPRKARVVVDMIREMPVSEALVALQFSDRRVSTQIAKLIESGVANIRNVIPDWDVDELIVARAWVNEGPTMRRFRPRAQGRATRINKRTSRVTIELRPEPVLEGDE